MKHEGQPEEPESEEPTEQLFEREIHKALSPTWAKSTQELLPGYLPNKSPGEYSPDELDRYRVAYAILGEMTQRGELEVLFEEESLASDPDSPVENETIAIPRFKLVTSGGKKSESPNVAWNGNLAPASPILRRDFLKSIGAGLTFAAFGLNSEAGNFEGREGSPFDPEVQTAALKFVTETMNVTLDAAVDLPVIVESEGVSDAEFNKIIGFDTEGKRQNLFLPPSTIFLLKKSEMHNLVHEYVHYVQYHYKKGLTDGTTDEVENQAIAIQNLFREKGPK